MYSGARATSAVHPSHSAWAVSSRSAAPRSGLGEQAPLACRPRLEVKTFAVRAHRDGNRRGRGCDPAGPFQEGADTETMRPEGGEKTGWYLERARTVTCCLSTLCMPGNTTPRKTVTWGETIVSGKLLRSVSKVTAPCTAESSVALGSGGTSLRACAKSLGDAASELSKICCHLCACPTCVRQFAVDKMGMLCLKHWTKGPHHEDPTLLQTTWSISSPFSTTRLVCGG